MPTSEPEHLSHHHRDTLRQLFRHPTSHNIEWHAVLSLLEAVGTVEQQHDGKYFVRIGGETEVLARPNHKDIDIQQVVDLRRMLTAAGYSELGEEPKPKGTAAADRSRTGGESPYWSPPQAPASNSVTRPPAITTSASASPSVLHNGVGTGSQFRIHAGHELSVHRTSPADHGVDVVALRQAYRGDVDLPAQPLFAGIQDERTDVVADVEDQ